MFWTKTVDCSLLSVDFKKYIKWKKNIDLLSDCV